MAERTCSYPGCDRPYSAKGYCKQHYERWRVFGDPALRRVGPGKPNPYLVVRDPSHPLAGTQGQVPEHRRVWYDAHGPIPEGYHVHHINGDKRDNRLENLALLTPAEHARVHRKNVGPCSIVGCEKPARIRGLCSAHHTRLLRTGDPLTPSRVRQKTGQCSVDGCDEEDVCRGMCRPHYRRDFYERTGKRQ